MSDRFDSTDFKEWVGIATTSADEVIRGLGDIQKELAKSIEMNGIGGDTLLAKKVERLIGAALGLQLLANDVRSDVAALSFVVDHPKSFSKAPVAAAAGNHTPHPASSKGRAQPPQRPSHSMSHTPDHLQPLGKAI